MNWRIAALLLTVVFRPGPVRAQGKAYETVRYQASWRDTTLVLLYADGYPAASTVRMQAGRTVLRLEPTSSEPDGDGTWTFQPAGTGADGPPQTAVVVYGIDAASGAPARVKGVFRAGLRRRTCLFRKG